MEVTNDKICLSQADEVTVVQLYPFVFSNVCALDSTLPGGTVAQKDCKTALFRLNFYVYLTGSNGLVIG